MCRGSYLAGSQDVSLTQGKPGKWEKPRRLGVSTFSERHLCVLQRQLEQDSKVGTQALFHEEAPVRLGPGRQLAPYNPTISAYRRQRNRAELVERRAGCELQLLPGCCLCQPP